MSSETQTYDVVIIGAGIVGVPHIWPLGNVADFAINLWRPNVGDFHPV